MLMISGIGGGGYDVTSLLAQQRSQNKFASVDKDGNGSVDKSEFQAFSDKLEKKTGKKFDAEKVFSLIDSNGDGSITKDEGAAFKAKMEKMSGNKRPFFKSEDVFTKNDTNGDGSLDKTEFSAFNDTMNKITGNSKNADEMFAKIDANSDGKISKTENSEFASKMKPAGGPEGPPPGGAPPPPGGGASGVSKTGSASGSEDLNSNGIPDDQENLDKNNNGISDYQEVTADVTNTNTINEQIKNSLIQQVMNAYQSAGNSFMQYKQQSQYSSFLNTQA